MKKAVLIKLDEEIINYLNSKHIKKAEIINEILKKEYPQAFN